MRKAIVLMLLVSMLVLPVGAVCADAPEVPQTGKSWMPDSGVDFGTGMRQMVLRVLRSLRPDLQEAVRCAAGAMAAVILVSLLETATEKLRGTVYLAGTAAITAMIAGSANSLIRLGAQTISAQSDYGKLLFPAMTAALAAQGGVTASTAIYIGTAAFDAFLSGALCSLFVPVVYLFLAAAVIHSASEEEILKRLKEQILKSVSWFLKTVLMVFTTYIGITGVVSGTTDAAALKAAKTAVSTVVPVIGGTLADASEAILVSAGLAKNAMGIYGIFALLALFLAPFFRIGCHYLILKWTAILSGLFDAKRLSDLIGDFSSAMGLLLAMTGTQCMLLLISMICFMKGGSG